MNHQSGSDEIISVRDIAKQLSQPGKGVLASDESPATMGKRLLKNGLDNTSENRQSYRALFYGANIGPAISGAILVRDVHVQSTLFGVSSCVS
jgi:fructose-bisphosphate aldolase class I